MSTKHLVTGSSGFLGRKIIQRLINEGKEVVGVDVIKEENPVSGAKYVVSDIRDEFRIEDQLNGVSIVYHTAALVPLTKAYSDFRSVNEEGSRVVAKLARKHGVEKFVHISSSAVFGKTSDSAITSNTPLVPIEPYGVSKLNAEIAVKQELLTSDTKLIVIRPRTILGTERGGIFDMFFRWVDTSEPIFTIGNGDQRFQFINVEDLIDAIFVTLQKGATGDYNVGTDTFGSLNESFRHLIEHAESKSKIRHLPVVPTMVALSALEKVGLSPLAPWHYKTFHLPFYFDVSPLLDLGWRPKFSNDAMLANSYDSFKDWSSISDGASSSPHSSKLDSRVLTTIQKMFR
jgi:nucleoside-diphosphate-sugar epimerase